MAEVTDRAVSAVHLISVTMGAAKKQNFIRETPALGPTPRSNPLPFTPDMWQKCPGVLGLIFAGRATGLSEPLPHYSQEP